MRRYSPTRLLSGGTMHLGSGARFAGRREARSSDHSAKRWEDDPTFGRKTAIGWGCGAAGCAVAAAAVTARRRVCSRDHFDSTILKPIDATHHLELALFDGRIQDRARRFQLRDIIDDVLPDRIVELIAGLPRHGF